MESPEWDKRDTFALNINTKESKESALFMPDCMVLLYKLRVLIQLQYLPILHQYLPDLGVRNLLYGFIRFQGQGCHCSCTLSKDHKYRFHPNGSKGYV